MKKYPKLEATRAYNPDGTRMQCKHIPDLYILQFLYDNQDSKVIDWRNEYDPTSIQFNTVQVVEAAPKFLKVAEDIQLDGMNLKKGEKVMVKGLLEVKHTDFTLTVAGLFPPNVPQKLIRAKMNSLQNRGLIEGGDGSPSGNGNRVGSRFDARITEKGMRRVEEALAANLGIALVVSLDRSPVSSHLMNRTWVKMHDRQPPIGKLVHTKNIEGKIGTYTRYSEGYNSLVSADNDEIVEWLDDKY